ncbi:MAG: CvpA family protein [Ruminococcaceae bacterium]|nr:CvpA family protein [Oscillospiraceae bacterium]
MHFVIDLILIAIIVIIAVITAKQGFVRAIVEAVGFIAAVLVAFSVSTPLAEVTYNKVVEPAIVNSVNDDKIENTNNTIDKVWESLPKVITKNANNFGISKESLEKTISQSTKLDAQTILTDVSQKVISPLVVGILKTVYAVVLVFILSFVVKLLAKLLNKAFSFSVVGKFNKFLGALVGVVKGVSLTVVLSEVVLLLISFTKNGIWIFNSANIDKTILFNFLTNVF